MQAKALTPQLTFEQKVIQKIKNRYCIPNG